MSITVFLVDDHTVVRDGLRALLEKQPDLIVIGDAANGREAVRQITQLRPNIVIMDIAMADLNGIEATQKICEAFPSIQVIILSMYFSPEHVERALAAGAHGYLLKESAGVEVVNAIRAVSAGHRYLSQKISDELIDNYTRQQKAASEGDPLVCLSAREREIFQLIAEGKSNVKIASILSLSPKTVETYRSRLMHKLGISDMSSLIKFAIQHGVIQL